ncbi:DNA/RNA helicase domain-containing protein [Streptomyces sp. NPDC059788]|uniref:DNA/RNA helicase domain-containing protein n=1 Tax=Streptomyces sp. NPDC059788 TaxID=3346948 RepID=UPI003648B583
MEELASSYFFTYRRRPSAAEKRSWEESISALASLLADAGLKDVEMLIEYQLPMCSLRADVILAGVHPETGEPAYVVVELKQWSLAHTISHAADLCEVPHARYRRALLHPVAQVDGYCEYLRDLTQVLDGHEERVSGVAYLHNATDAAVQTLLSAAVADGRLFTKNTREALMRFLRRKIAQDTEHRAGDALLRSRRSPGTKLMNVAAEVVLQRDAFTLLGEQRKAFSLVLRTLELARKPQTKKELVLITGGPGSGKSVIALSLLGELSRQGRRVAHATGSKSFTKTLQTTICHGRRGTGKLFTYFNSYTNMRANDLEVLLLDEAHRIRETSNGAPAGSRWARQKQIEELITAAQVPVFLLDQHQVVRPGETGTVEVIEKTAREKDIVVRHVDLDGQFRCGGSRAYEAWVLRLLGLEQGGPVPWTGKDTFCLEVADSPEDLEERLLSKCEPGQTARIAAGFCWPWSDPKDDGTPVDDVCIGAWRRPWNINDKDGAGDLPSSDLWATHPNGFSQIGCIYTAQGFEYDWSGVIIGPDLVWREGGWRTVRSASEDPALSDASADDFGRLIRNTYKVLLTRGMAGTVVYATDAGTRAKLREIVRERAPRPRAR